MIVFLKKVLRLKVLKNIIHFIPDTKKKNDNVYILVFKKYVNLSKPLYHTHTIPFIHFASMKL